MYIHTLSINPHSMHATINSFSREISSFFDNYFKEEDLATSYIELLIMLLEHDAIPQQEIAELMNLAPSTITRFVKKLEKRGLVKKKKDEGKVKVLLSDDGVKAAKRYRKSYRAAVKALAGVLGDKYVETTEQLLEHGITLLKEAEEQSD